MASGELPAVARRRLRLALRRARESKGFTQGQVAEGLYWSLSKIQRIESGDVTVSATDVQALLGVYGVTDPERVAALVADARAARRRGWWDEPKYREHLTPGTMELLQFEGQATVIRFFSLTLVPGIVQTRELAFAVLEELGPHGLTAEDRAVRLEVRLRRREQVFERPEPPAYQMLLDESVLYREIGGQRVAADQLQDLLVLARSGAFILRILPFAVSTPATTLLGGSFTILDLESDEDGVLYREMGMTDAIVHASDEVGRYRMMFDELWGRALNEDASRHMLEARHAQLMTALSRNG